MGSGLVRRIRRRSGCLVLDSRLRLERPSDQNLVVAPRINVKWTPHPLWDLRLNSGRGYRRVHLFTEEHAALDGSREVLLAEGGLNPESSWNANLNLTRTLGTDRWTGSASLQAFGTLFTDRIYADYDSLPNAIVYRNIEGLGWNRGVSGDVWMNGSEGWQAALGATWLRSELFESGSLSGEGDPVEFAPSWTTNLKVGQSRSTWGWNLTGPNRWPHGHPVLQRVFQRRQRALRAHARFGEPVLCGCRRRQTHPFSWGSERHGRHPTKSLVGHRGSVRRRFRCVSCLRPLGRPSRVLGMDVALGAALSAQA